MHVCAMIDARGRASSAAACGGNIAQRFKPRISVIHAEQSNGSTCTCSRPSPRLSRHPASQHRACVRVRVSARAHNSLTRARAHDSSLQCAMAAPHSSQTSPEDAARYAGNHAAAPSCRSRAGRPEALRKALWERRRGSGRERRDAGGRAAVWVLTIRSADKTKGCA